jgi:hypothetical protein
MAFSLVTSHRDQSHNFQHLWTQRSTIPASKLGSETPHITVQMNTDKYDRVESTQQDDFNNRETADAINGTIKFVDNTKTAMKVAQGLGAGGVVAGTAAAGGAGMMSGLAAVGGVVGGGAVAGIGVLGAAPIAAAQMVMNQVLEDDARLSNEEREARAVGRTMTTVGAVAGTAGTVGTIAAAGSVAGLSGAGITSGLAAIGGTVGGGMGAGIAITVAAPAVVAAGVGYGAYKIWQWLTSEE